MAAAQAACAANNISPEAGPTQFWAANQAAQQAAIAAQETARQAAAMASGAAPVEVMAAPAVSASPAASPTNHEALPVPDPAQLAATQPFNPTQTEVIPGIASVTA